MLAPCIPNHLIIIVYVSAMYPHKTWGSVVFNVAAHSVCLLMYYVFNCMSLRCTERDVVDSVIVLYMFIASVGGNKTLETLDDVLTRSYCQSHLVPRSYNLLCGRVEQKLKINQ